MTLVVSNLRFGLGKTTLAKHLAQLPEGVRKRLTKWAKKSGSLYVEACPKLLGANYLQLDLTSLPEPSDRIQTLSHALALLVWRTVVGETSDHLFDPVRSLADRKSRHSRVTVQGAHSLSALLKLLDQYNGPTIVHIEEEGCIEDKKYRQFFVSDGSCAHCVS